MGEEYLDVVDADNRVVGIATRREVHARGLTHRAAHVLVFDPHGRLYLQRRALTKECSPGLWDTSAAGHLDAGEDYATAARRELAEELGVRPDDELAFVCRLAASPATGAEFVEVFRARIHAEVRPDPSEIIEGRWCTPEEVDAWLAARPTDFTGTFRLIWQRAAERREESRAL